MCMEMGISTQPYICFLRKAVSVYFLSLSPMLCDVLYSSSPMQCVWRWGYPHSLTPVPRGRQFLYIFSHFLLLCDVLYFSSPMQCVWRWGYPHSLTSVSWGRQFLYIFSHFLLCYVMFYILVHLCNVYGDGDIHTALHLFPEEGSFCILSLTFSFVRWCFIF